LQKRKREIEWPYFCTAVIGAFNTTSEINGRRPKLQLYIRNALWAVYKLYSVTNLSKPVRY